MDPTLYQTLIFAGLTHDVGKFLRKEDEAEQRQRRWGRASNKEGGHPLDSANFLKKVGANRLPLDWELLRNIVECHHNNERLPPEYDRWGRLLSWADKYSAYERPEETGPQETTLVSIFSGLDIGFPTPPLRFYRQAPLDLTADAEAIFPTDQEEPDTAAYHRDITAFGERFQALLAQGLPLADLNVSLLSLLERYTWATTSAEQVRPRDISLFDHLRTTAAIAACLYLYHADPAHPLSQAALEDHNTPKFLLVGGDLSGIQSYLYEIANVGVGGGVAKRLRARSFWLTSLVDVTAHRLLDELLPEARLPLCALLWSNGGRFVLLAPNLEKVSERLIELDRAVNGWLHGVAEGDLAIHFASVELRGDDFYIARQAGEDEALLPRSRITAKLAELQEALQERKTRRFEQLLIDEHGWQGAAFVHDYSSDDYAAGECQSCCKLPAEVQEPDASGEPIRYCGLCADDRHIGARLVQLTHIAYYRGQPTIAGDRLARDLRERTLHFFDGPAERQVLVIDEEFRRQPIPPQPYLVEWVSGSEELVTAAPLLRRYLANYVPRIHDLLELDQTCGKCKERRAGQAGCETYAELRSMLQAGQGPVGQSFDCLAAAAEGERLLGVLRMDVDRLGLLFQQGMGERTSISRVATLSRMVDLFFAGWVDRTLEREFDLCYTVYSGGDDLFIVGPWDQAIRLAQRIAERFRAYTSENPNTTLSAGVAVTKPHFPIAKAAQRAGEYLNGRAKGEGRARLHLFGTTAVWRLGEPAPDEVVDVAELLGDWGPFLDGQLAQAEARPGYPFSTSAAHRLLRYAEMCRRWQEDGAIHSRELRWLSQLEYDLARNIKPEEHPGWEQELAEVRARLRTLGLDKREVMGKLRLPVTWALLRHRRQGE